MVQDTYQNGVRAALFVSGALSNSALVYICVVSSGKPRPGRPRSPKPAQEEIPNRFHFPEISQNQRKYHPGSPRKSRTPHKIVENTPEILQNHRKSPISLENLATWVETAGIGDFSGGPGKIWENLGGTRATKVSGPLF